MFVEYITAVIYAGIFWLLLVIAMVTLLCTAMITVEVLHYITNYLTGMGYYG